MQASKALTSNSKFILDHLFVIVDGENKVKVDQFEQLIRFFDVKIELNIVLAGYVSEFINKLMEVYFDELACYFFDRPQKLNAVIYHLYDASICKSIVSPLVFRSDHDMGNSILENKIKKEQIEKLLRPHRARLVTDIWNRCVNSQNVEFVPNVLCMFKEAVTRSPKEEIFKMFLYDTLYSKSIVSSLFQYMLNVEVN